MNKITKFATFAAFAVLFVACQNNSPAPEKISGEALISTINERNMTVNFNQLEGIDLFDASTLKGTEIENIQLKSRESLSQRDREDVSTIMREFMSAEKVNAELDVQLLMSDAPVEDGVFVFSIETTEKQNLAIEMYDEEGFEMAANNRISLHEGINYKALNVKSLESGQYMFLLKDDLGRELIRKITVKH